jgi:GntR family transcriptional regulator
MLIKVDAGSSEPLFAQIAAQVRAGIAKGRIAEGERLPSARELADALGVNMHTVLRAYGDLRDEGLVDMRRRRGVIVRPATDGRARLLELARDLAAEAARQGITKAELGKLLEEVAP